VTGSRENLAVVGVRPDDGGDGLVTFAVDPDRHTLERRDTVEAANPSFFAFHPSNETLVAVEEVEDGSFVSYHLDDETGRLRQPNRTSSGGDGPCHVAIDPTGEYAVISHYAGWSVGLVGLGREGELAGLVAR
jgi:6-phosphogluconolactonase